MNILITGVNGWVGAALAQHCRERGHDVLGSSRQGGAPGVIATGDISAHTDWREALAGREAVVHVAARVHVMREREACPLSAFRAVNTEGTLRLARQAAEVGVRRFVFVSSIKVNGEHTEPGRPFRHDQPPTPLDAYGQSKAEAEVGLRRIAADAGLELTVVRPPLVYGPGVKANFAALGRWIERGRPLPFGRLDQNRRSLVSLRNLLSLLSACVEHPWAAGQTFLASDGQDLSTRQLAEHMAAALGRRPRLLDVPPSLLIGLGRLTGRSGAIDRLLQSLQVDIEHTRSTLDWAPPQSVEQAMLEWARAPT